MTNDTFIKEIYEPYNEAYKLIKQIKDCGHNDSEDTWMSFIEELDAYSAKHDTKMGHILARMITDAADAVADLNEEEKEDVQELCRRSLNGRRAV